MPTALCPSPPLSPPWHHEPTSANHCHGSPHLHHHQSSTTHPFTTTTATPTSTIINTHHHRNPSPLPSHQSQTQPQTHPHSSNPLPPQPSTTETRQIGGDRTKQTHAGPSKHTHQTTRRTKQTQPSTPMPISTNHTMRERKIPEKRK